MRGIRGFLDFVDEEGISNQEKITRNQRIIRRLPTTDKSKSYEDADSSPEAGEWPAGVVLEDGRLIGFGIHILNEDIYPLQSFEIYLRSCGLTGRLDLSGCRDLLFVDVYHNRIASVDVRGASSLRILGVQDNQLASLDVRDLVSCRGIDAGKNRLSSLDLSRCDELAELYINDNRFSEIDLRSCPKQIGRAHV